MTLALAGCTGSGSEYHPVPKDISVRDEPHSHEHGPHGGHLVELGEEQYHAEVVYDAKTKKITIYILDSTAKAPHATDSKQITLTLAISGKNESFPVDAVPQEGDPKGKSSRFELAGNAAINSHIKDEEDLKGSVDVTIDGKKFSGEIKHEH